jgi:ribosome modulation factor
VSRATKARKVDNRQQRRDRVHEEGRRSAYAGQTEDDCPYGQPPFPNGYELQERSDWLWGFKAGRKDLDALADEAVWAVAATNPVAVAALRYAAVEQETSTLRNPAARAEAARALVDALATEQIRGGHRAAQEEEK